MKQSRELKDPSQPHTYSPGLLRIGCVLFVALIYGMGLPTLANETAKEMAKPRGAKPPSSQPVSSYREELVGRTENGLLGVDVPQEIEPLLPNLSPKDFDLVSDLPGKSKSNPKTGRRDLFQSETVVVTGEERRLVCYNRLNNLAKDEGHKLRNQFCSGVYNIYKKAFDKVEQYRISASKGESVALSSEYLSKKALFETAKASGDAEKANRLVEELNQMVNSGGNSWKSPDYISAEAKLVFWKQVNTGCASDHPQSAYNLYYLTRLKESLEKCNQESEKFISRTKFFLTLYPPLVGAQKKIRFDGFTIQSVDDIDLESSGNDSRTSLQLTRLQFPDRTNSIKYRLDATDKKLYITLPSGEDTVFDLTTGRFSSGALNFESTDLDTSKFKNWLAGKVYETIRYQGDKAKVAYFDYTGDAYYSTQLTSFVRHENGEIEVCPQSKGTLWNTNEGILIPKNLQELKAASLKATSTFRK